MFTSVWKSKLARRNLEDFLQLIRERTDTNIFHVPTWRIGLWPEELDAQNDPDESSVIIRVDITD